MVTTITKEAPFADEVLVYALETFDDTVSNFQRYQKALTVNPDCYQTRQFVLREAHRHQEVNVSLEDFASQQGNRPLTVAVEGLVERWMETRRKLLNRLTNGLVSNNKVLARKRAVATMRARAAGFKEIASGIQTKKITLGSDSQYLVNGGRLPTSIGQALTNDIRGIAEITQKYIPGAIDFSRTAQRAFAEALRGNKDDIVKRLEEVAARPHPMVKLSKPLLDGTQLTGNVYIRVNLKTYGDTLDEIKAMAGAQPPRLKRRKVKQIDATNEVSISQAEVMILIRCLEKYADLMEKTNTDLLKLINSLDMGKTILPTQQTPNSQLDHRGMQSLRKLANGSTMQAVQIVPDVFNHIRQRAKVIIGLLDKTLNTDEL